MIFSSRLKFTLIRLLAGILVTGGFAACTTTDVPNVLGSVDSVKITIFDSGEVTSENVVSTDVESIAVLEQWLITNRRGWNRDERTYAPGILLSTADFSINLLQRKIIVVSHHEEYVRDLSAEEYATLSEPFLRK
jgi:hypothetical protein